MKVLFANSLFIYFWFIIFFPLLIHLIAKSRPPKLYFPSLQFLKPIVNEHKKHQKPKDILLLILRTLIIFIVLLIFLKPYSINKNFIKQTTANKNYVILIDASLSMNFTENGISKFQTAIQKAKEIVRSQSGAGNIVWMGNKSYKAFNENIRDELTLIKELERGKILYTALIIETGISTAIELLASKKNCDIYIISDFQESNWRSFNSQVIPSNINIIYIPVAKDKLPNLNISNVTFIPQSPIKGEPFKIIFKINNFSDIDAERILYLTTGNIKKSQSTFIPANSSKTLFFEVVLNNEGLTPVNINFAGDNLQDDNNYYSVINILPAITIGFYGNIDNSSNYLRAAVESGNKNKYKFSVLTELPEKADILFIYKNFNETIIKEYFKNKIPVIIFLTSEYFNSLDQYNLNENIKFQINENIELTKPVSIAPVKPYHKILEVFENGISGDISDNNIFSYKKITTNNFTNILKYPDNIPALCEIKSGLNKCMLWNIPLDFTKSNFSGKPVFLPLVHEIIEYYRPQQNIKSINSGDYIIFKSGVSKKIGEPLIVDSEKKNLNFKTLINGNEINYTTNEPAGKAGFYYLKSKDKILDIEAVNSPESESKLEYLNPKSFNNNINNPVVWTDASAEITEANHINGYWQYAGLFLLILLILESIIILLTKKQEIH